MSAFALPTAGQAATLRELAATHRWTADCKHGNAIRWARGFAVRSARMPTREEVFEAIDWLMDQPTR